jgi:hypothetical protein
MDRKQQNLQRLTQMLTHSHTPRINDRKVVGCSESFALNKDLLREEVLKKVGEQQSRKFREHGNSIN